MAGKRQHTLPKFLLKGFLSREQRNEVFAWVFYGDRNPFETNIKNIAVENFFYSDANDTSVDDEITNAEVKYSQLLDSLRNSPPGPVDDPTIARFLAHLTVRTRHLRMTFQSATKYAMKCFQDFLDDSDRVKNFLERQIRSNPSLLTESIQKDFNRLGLSGNSAQRLADLCTAHLDTLLQESDHVIHAYAQILREVLPLKLPGAMKNGHLRALRQGIEPAMRVAEYEKLSFRIQVFPEGGIIIGDSGTIFFVDDSRRFKAFTEKEDVIVAVVLPISSTQLLIGESTPFNVTKEYLNRVIAKCSLEYFVGSRNATEHDALRSLIGQKAEILSEMDIERIFIESIQS